MMHTKEQLLESLNAFDATERSQGLATLCREHGAELPAPGTNFNMHMHSFFSFNSHDWSPSRIAWESRQAGLFGAGLCEFDVLDGLEEFLAAGRQVGLRTSVHVETRVFLAEYAEHEITSPGEPGVTYIMGAGFARNFPAGSPPAEGLDVYRQRARERNLALLDRVNEKIPEVAIDYERDVLPLTPGGNATERHIIRAYKLRGQAVFESGDKMVAYWASVLGREEAAIRDVLPDEPALEEMLRAGLVKKGGLAYEQPSESTFPPIDDFIEWVLLCDAMPMITYVDGASSGEEDIRALLECQMAKGCVSLNIIPDRNWNLKDADEAAIKIAKLDDCVAHATDLHLPINIGTEMNKLGLPFVDDLDGEALRPHREAFTRGAAIFIGQSLLHRYAGFSYTGAARDAFPDLPTRNAFFESVGRLPPVDASTAQKLEDLGEAGALAWCHEQVAAGA
jgi:hypothetical protein